jgi:DNA repair exonuclease SbcCD ATPase subunit
MTRQALIACILVPLVVLSGRATAATDSEVEQLRQQLRSTVLQLRELQDQQAAAAAPQAAPGPDTTALNAKLTAVEGQLRAARRSAGAVASLQASLTKAQADNTALTAAAASSASELEKYKSAYDQSTEAARALAVERDRLKVQFDLSVKVGAACQAKNTRLIAFAESLIDASRKVGFGQVLAAREPILGLRRVQLENIAQEREDTVRANRCTAQMDGVAPTKATPAPGG